MALPDPTTWLDDHGDYLFRYAMIRLRDQAHAEDAVQETLLAALRSYETFTGRSSERTWLVGILKHKLIDHFRARARELPSVEDELAASPADDPFRRTDGWDSHWNPAVAPVIWSETPETSYEQSEFWNVFDECISPLPERAAQAFTLREIDGLSADEVCDALGVSTSNLWVLLHRARLRLRRCIEVNWFQRPAVRG